MWSFNSRSVSSAEQAQMLVAAGRLEFNQTRTNARSSCCQSALLLLPAPYMAARLPHEILNDLRTEANSPSPPLEEEWQDRILGRVCTNRYPKAGRAIPCRRCVREASLNLQEQHTFLISPCEQTFCVVAGRFGCLPEMSLRSFAPISKSRRDVPCGCGVETWRPTLPGASVVATVPKREPQLQTA